MHNQPLQPTANRLRGSSESRLGSRRKSAGETGLVGSAACVEFGVIRPTICTPLQLVEA